MTHECPARLAFPTAPYLDLRCNEPPGHDGLHRTNTVVDAATVPYAQRDRMAGGYAKTRERIYITWAQHVASASDRDNT